MVSDLTDEEIAEAIRKFRAEQKAKAVKKEDALPSDTKGESGIGRIKENRSLVRDRIRLLRSRGLTMTNLERKELYASIRPRRR